MSEPADQPEAQGPTPSDTPAPPPVPSLELERLRREVRARLFGAEQQAVKIGRYVVLDCIGQGGMGIVYSAKDERLGRTVAIKLLKPELSETRASNLATEAQALAKLSHPNVVSVFDVGEHDGQLFVAMEYVEGQNLRRWMQGRRTLAEILDVFAAAGEGLAAAHRAGLVHRDFKPDNVLVGSEGRPRILDFGLARSPSEIGGDAVPAAFADDAEATATSLSRHGVLLGTPAYMAPEQHLGERADARSDQFGFCVALYQAVYGALPFPSDDLRALSLAIVGGRMSTPPVKAGVPESLRRLIIRGLRVDPGARFSSMDAVLAELRSIRESLDNPGQINEVSTLESDPTVPVIKAELVSESAPEPVYDTRAIARVFGREDAPSSGQGRPPLSESELREIADEVGLELSTPAQRVASEPKPVARKRPPERTHLGLAATVSAERELPVHPSYATQRRIVRELEQNLGGAGVVEQFEAGMAWSNKQAEASIDRRPGGAVLTLRRSFDRLARKRRRRGMFIGSMAGVITGGVLTDLIPSILSVFEPFVVFGGIACGILGGLRVAQQIHQRHMDEERKILDWLGERVEILTTADHEPRALPAAGDRVDA